MPTDFLALDTGLAALSGNGDPNERMDKMTSYLYMLLEQLRWTLANLDMGNFNETGLAEIQNTFSEPIYGRIEDAEGKIAVLTLTAESLGLRMSDAEGNISTLVQTATLHETRIQNAEGDISSLTQTATSLTSRVQNAEGDISTLTQTATSLTSRVQNAEGSISSLTQTATSLSSRIQNAEGSISSLSQTVNGFTLSVENGDESSTIRLMSNGVAISSQVISITGMVTFTDLSTSGQTIINGDNITTGTIDGTRFICRVVSGNDDSGQILAMDGNATNGGLRLDVDDEDGDNRLYLYTNVGAHLKLHSGRRLSIDSNQLFHIASGADLELFADDDIYISAAADGNGGTVYLYGDYIYVNGQELSEYILELVGGGSSGGSSGGGTTTPSPSVSTSYNSGIITGSISNSVDGTTYSYTFSGAVSASGTLTGNGGTVSKVVDASQVAVGDRWTFTVTGVGSSTKTR